MSYETFARFFGGFLESPAGEAARKEFAGITDQPTLVARLVAVGQAHGFAFTAEDVLAVLEASAAMASKAGGAQGGELGEDDLMGVVGGLTSNAVTLTVKLRTIAPNLKCALVTDGSVFKV